MYGVIMSDCVLVLSIKTDDPLTDWLADRLTEAIK